MQRYAFFLEIAQYYVLRAKKVDYLFILIDVFSNFAVRLKKIQHF
jgi:hypothetical protein